MPLAVPPPDYQVVRPDVAFSRYREVPYRGEAASEFDVTKRLMKDIRYGQTTYKLRQPLRGGYSPMPTVPGGCYRVEGFPSSLVGQGESPDTAYADWVKNFHVTFQRLYVIRPFEMSEVDKPVWAAIESLVDVDLYRTSQPLIVLQQGKVGRARPFPEFIRWEDGTTERVNLARMPGEFVNFPTGQPFEAMVHRHPVSHKLIKVEYVKRIRPNHLTVDEAKELWDSVPTSASLPKT